MGRGSATGLGDGLGNGSEAVGLGVGSSLRPLSGSSLRPLSEEECHRARAADAFAVGWAPLAERNRFLVRVRWPTDHPFFAPVHGGVHDPLLLVESMRQSAMALLHAGLGVPLDRHFLLRDIEYRCRPEGMGVGARTGTGMVTGTGADDADADADAADDIDFEVVFSELGRRGRPVSQLRVDWIVHRFGRVVATGTGHARLAAPQVYHRLRGGRVRPGVSEPTEAAKASAHMVGRTRPEDVLLASAAEDGLWEVLPDTRHEFFFQRPNDHIPGMLFLEAARQAACALAAPAPFVPLGGGISFQRYAEFGVPCLIRTHTTGDQGAGPLSVRAVGTQEGNPVFDCTLAAGPPR